jgi:hypothetical protein
MERARQSTLYTSTLWTPHSKCYFFKCQNPNTSMTQLQLGEGERPTVLQISPILPWLPQQGHGRVRRRHQLWCKMCVERAWWEVEGLLLGARDQVHVEQRRNQLIRLWSRMLSLKVVNWTSLVGCTGEFDGEDQSMETTDFFLPRNQVLNMFKMFVCDPVSFPCLGDMVGITIYSMLKNIYAIKGNQDPQ